MLSDAGRNCKSCEGSKRLGGRHGSWHASYMCSPSPSAKKETCLDPYLPRNPSGNQGLSTDGSRGVIRVVVCALHPLRPSWLGASEESAPNDENGAQKASSCGHGGLGAGDCRSLRLALTVSRHQAHVRDHGRHHQLQAGLGSPKVSALPNSQLYQRVAQSWA